MLKNRIRETRMDRRRRGNKGERLIIFQEALQRICAPSANIKTCLRLGRWPGTRRSKRWEKKEKETTASCIQQRARTDEAGGEDDDSVTLQTAALTAATGREQKTQLKKERKNAT